MKFTEAQLEDAIIQLLGQQGFPHVDSRGLVRDTREVLIKEDLRRFLTRQYAEQCIIGKERLNHV